MLYPHLDVIVKEWEGSENDGGGGGGGVGGERKGKDTDMR